MSTPSAPEWSRPEKSFLAGALVVAYLMRFAHWQSLSSYAWFDFLGLDALYYDEWAKRILRDGLQGQDPFFMGPLYPYLLAGVYKLFGSGLDAMRHIQLVMSTASVAIVHLLARRVGGRTLAMVASGATAVYGPLVYYSVSILYPTLTVLLAASLLLLLLESAARRSVGLAFAAGAVLGVYALGRGNILLFAPCAFFWLLAAWGRPFAPSRRGWRTALPAGAALTAGTVLLILPATIHNVRAGDFALLTTNGGLNFYIGNGPMANGGHMTPVLYLEQPDGSVEAIEADLTKDVECRTEAERATGRRMKYSEVSSFWFHETLKSIRRNPGHFAALLLMKTVHFWSTYEIPQVEHFGYFRRFSLPLQGPVLSFTLLGPLSVLGMALGLRRPGRWALLYLFVAAYSVSIILFFVLARYRLPIVPALVPFAAYGALETVRAARERRWLFVGPAVAGAIVCGWAMQANFYGVDESKGIAQILYRRGIVEDAHGNREAAIEWYREALRLKPDYPKGHLNLGVDLARVGRRDEAMEHLLEAERLDPEYYRAPYNRGTLLEDLGRHEEAREAYASAVEKEPRYLPARLKLAEMHAAAGDTASAREQIDAVLAYDGRWDPESNDAVRQEARRWEEYLDWRSRLAASQRGVCFAESRLFRLAEVARMRGRIEEALAVLRIYFEDGGHCAEAYAALGRILVGMGETEGARDALQRALREDGGFPGARVGLAQLAAGQGRIDEAVQMLREEIRRNPAFPGAYLELGLVHERLLDDPDGAAEWFTRYREAGGSPEYLASRRARWAASTAAPPSPSLPQPTEE
jgi:tetratricopeptide (TPR) repeat protein/4-amino-4-deoxy-L-arabinose transferase-like glycosyltransferase